jgi:hypothetical protein
MELDNYYYYKRLSLVVGLLSFSVTAIAHPGHNDVATVHGPGIGVWLAHQVNVDSVLTILMFAVVAALMGGRALFRRRRLRRLASG